MRKEPKTIITIPNTKTLHALSWVHWTLGVGLSRSRCGPLSVHERAVAGSNDEPELNWSFQHSGVLISIPNSRALIKDTHEKNAPPPTDRETAK